MLLGFKKRFKEPILIGTKVFTLRKRRKVRPKIGETIHMYVGLRTKHTELITNKEKLMSTQNVRVLIQAWPADHKSWNSGIKYEARIYVERRLLSVAETYQFVQYDGFKDLADFCEHWLSIPGKKKLKTRIGALMEMYHWTDLRF